MTAPQCVGHAFQRGTCVSSKTDVCWKKKKHYNGEKKKDQKSAYTTTKVSPPHPNTLVAFLCCAVTFLRYIFSAPKLPQTYPFDASQRPLFF